MGAYGLKTHIWNNNLKSILLLILFPILVLAMVYAGLLLWAGFVEGRSAQAGLNFAANSLPAAIPFTLAGVGAWFGIAFMGHQALIDMATKSKSISESDEPRPYKLLENLCISRGITMPRLKIIETDVMNAFASGIRTKNYTITLTRGLMNNLDDEELEAVIAHELSHIKNKDVRLLIIAVIFVGIISFFGEGVVRGMFRTNMSRTTRSRRSGEGNAAVLIVIAIVIIIIAYGLAMLIRFALSRKREYLADAGAVELTKNPDAMIRALQKISGRAKLDAPAEVREMAFENPRVGISDMFATHPPIEKRIAALVEFAGGRDDTESRPKRRSALEAKKRNGKTPRPFGRLGGGGKP
ncbi:MAG: M48 family metallopeptidase [Robiginitomaculum sp.]|nr:M48 family metallopeptidase [Robiginitomaculum sp.]